MSSRKKITIITVTYNAKNLLEKTISSILSQDSTDFEYLIIDGASNDETKNLLENLSSNIVSWISETDSGIYDAMNKGIKLAKGDWTLFLNAGDTLVNSKTISDMIQHLSDEYSFIYGDRNRILEDGTVCLENAGNIDDTIKQEVVFHQSLLTRTSLLKSNPYNTTYKLAADFEYVVKSWSEGLKFKKIPIIISNFLSGGISSLNHTLLHLEASHILAKIQHNESGMIRNNSFFKSLVRANIGYAINSNLKVLQHRHKNLEFYIDINDEKLKISTNTNSAEAHELLNFINQPFSNVVVKRLDKDESQQPFSPLFSIITVTYNAVDFLKATIQSVTNQTYQDVEYIIIDGGSDDGTLALIHESNHLITNWISEPDSGIYDAMNKGINLARGQWINFMNAGDEFSDRKVLEIMAKKINSESEIVYGDRYYVSKGQKKLQKAKPINTIFERMPFGHQSTFIKTSILKKYRFNDTYKFSADYDLLIKLYLNNHNFQQVNIPICNFIAGGQSESGLRPYLEAIKILLDNTNDKNIIANNAYFKAFKRIGNELLEAAVGK